MTRKLLAISLGFFKVAASAATRESILGASDRIAGYLDIPEWGGRVYVATLTVAQRAQFLEALSKLQAGNDSIERATNYYRAQVSLVADGVVGADSVPLFTSVDTERLATKSPALVGRVYDEIVRLNGFSFVSTEDKAKN